MGAISNLMRPWVGAIVMLTLLAGCGSPSDLNKMVVGIPGDVAAGDVAPRRNFTTSFQNAYRLGVGDKLRIIVFGEPDLTGEFDIDSTGIVAYPLVGQVQAVELTLREFEQAVVDKLKNGYLNNPSVSVEVINFRPFTIMGEVKEPGEYPYRSGMNVINAVANAKGYSYRANQNAIYITRAGQRTEVRVPTGNGILVFPGDIIRVPPRLF